MLTHACLSDTPPTPPLSFHRTVSKPTAPEDSSDSSDSERTTPGDAASRAAGKREKVTSDASEEEEPNRARDFLSPDEHVCLDTPSLDSSIVGCDIMFCFNPPTGWQRGTIAQDVRAKRHQFNFFIEWEDGEEQNLKLRLDMYTAEGHKPSSWFIVSS